MGAEVKKRRWSDAERDFLRKNFKTMSYGEIAAALGRSYGSVEGQAHRMGTHRICRLRPPDRVVLQVCEAAAILGETTTDDIMSKSKLANDVWARWLVIRVLRWRRYSMPAIGKALKRDHTSIHHALTHQPVYGPKFAMPVVSQVPYEAAPSKPSLIPYVGKEE